MSFSTRVKEELSRHIGSGRHCKIAEIAAIINMCGKIKQDANGDISIKVQTENAAVARKYFTIIKKTFNINVEVLIRRNSYLKKNRVYIMYLTNNIMARKVLKATKLIDINEDQVVIFHRIHPLVVQSVCCKRAYIRGAFLASGSMSDPEKTYHLEFVNLHKKHSQELMELINSFEMDAKIVERKKYFVVYLKEGTQIVDLLNIMEGHIALMELENLRILKEMRNNVNRIVNCETANLNKTVSASVRQIEDIEYIEATIGLSSIPDPLEDMAKLRLIYRDATLKELGTMLDPPVGKSGVNHRLRKISEIAEKLRDN
ncbi:MAG: DNA-binding protein WhiA [Firmicutes bacterium HGW-Firmicutes-7]|nr:MAG: DNA-binding protein WhiA [Firmicutes bacterium HGW-Firmicutes-7]